MNRRQFLQSTLIAAGSLFVPSSILASKSTPKISWEDFDWMPYPSCLAFRVEVKDGKHELVSIPYYCKTCKLTLNFKEGDKDLSIEQKKITQRIKLPPYQQYPNGKEVDVEYTVYTNETLLLDAQRLGFTHIYTFQKTPKITDPNWVFRRGYYIRGAKLPDWKTNRGKLQIVNV